MNKLTYIYKLLLEGRVEDVKEKYFGKGNLRSEKDYQILVQHDPSDNHKYLEWMAKELARKGSWVLNVSPHYLVGLVKRFHDNLHKIEKKDLYQYQGWKDLEDTVKVAESKLSKSEEKRIQKQGSKLLYSDDRFLVVSPKTQEASCYYGSGTRWCTAAKKNNQFENYTEDGILVYIIDKWSKPPKKEHYDEDGDVLPQYEKESQRGDYEGDLDHYLTYSKLAMHIPFDSYKPNMTELGYYDYEMYDGQDDLISDDGPWYDWMHADEGVTRQIGSKILDYLSDMASEHMKKGPGVDTKLFKGVVENFDNYSKDYKFGNAWSNPDNPTNRGFDIVDNGEKYFVSVGGLRTNQYDTVYLEMEIVDYENPDGVLDSVRVDKRVPNSIFISEYDFDPQLIHWTCLVIQSTATALIKRYEMKKRRDEK
jgi:hypothetical protein